jgi:DNA helicase IV
VILAPVGLTKGLEFDVVVLVSPASLTSEVDQNRHYVGCSRARTGLTVVTTED